MRRKPAIWRGKIQRNEPEKPTAQALGDSHNGGLSHGPHSEAMPPLPKFCPAPGLWHRWGATTKPGPCARERNRKRQRRHRGAQAGAPDPASRGNGLSEREICPFQSGPHKPPRSRLGGKFRRKDLTIEEIWVILFTALPCHGRRFPLSGVNFWHPQTKARGWSQWLHGRSFSPFVCSLSQLSPLTNGIDKNKEVTAQSAQIPVTSL